ncbi:MAG: germination protein YpeB [Clostridia bacterium]|nr:germination protein YpeB [Clostridia bacterium]
MDKTFEKRRKESGYALIPKSVMAIFCYILPALLVAALIVTGVWGSSNLARAEELRRTNEGVYRQAYIELADSVYSMQLALSKLMVSESPSTLMETLDDIRFESGTIAGLMGRIPQSHPDTYELNRFLIRIGDYAQSLSNALRRGGSLSEEDRGQLMEAFTASEAVFNELSERLSSGNIPLTALDGSGFFSQTAQNGGESGSSQDAANSSYPALVYDGPYSESAENREPLGLTGGDMDDMAANKRAAEYLEDEGASLEYGGISDGKIPFHGFSGTLSDGRSAEIALSVAGGQLLYLRTDGERAIGGEGRRDANGSGSGNIGGEPTGEGAQNPDDEELSRLEEAGKAWLSRMGYPEMEATNAQYYENSVMICYAAVQRVSFSIADGGLHEIISDDADMSEVINAIRSEEREDGAEESRVILYNDTVKLWLSRESGGVICADARSFLFSHTERELPSEIVSGERAAMRLSPNLELEKRALALIPMIDGSERLCYEFTGSFAGESYIVYLDAETGDEVRISRIINDENGSSVL